MEPCTNFVFIMTDRAEEIYRFMLENSVAIRKFRGAIRITSGTDAENKRVIEILDKFFSR